jgi:hypothetical protein
LVLVALRAQHKHQTIQMALLEFLVVLPHLVRTYRLLVGSSATVVQIQLLLAVLVLVFWIVQAGHIHELVQMPLYMGSLVVVLLLLPQKLVTLLVLAAVLVVAVLLFQRVSTEAVLTKVALAAVAVGAFRVPVVTLVARAVQILAQRAVAEQLARQTGERAALVLSVRAVAVAVLVLPLPPPLRALVVQGVLAVAVAVVAVRQMPEQIQALAVLAVMVYAVSTLGKELT